MMENNCEAGIMPSEEKVKEQIGALIDKFYIENIKSVVFIDDDFSTLETLLKDSMNNVPKEELSEPVEDPDASLFVAVSQEDPHTEAQECCSASEGGESPYLCNSRVYKLVSSAHKKGLLVDILNDYPTDNDFWKRADLLVLDYKINNSPDKTLNVLKQLSDKSDYNLVVVYTHESVSSAAESVSRILECYPDTTHVSDRKENANLYHMQVDFDDHPWVACRNLFVVFVPKVQDEKNTNIDKLVEALKNALKQYSPSPMDVLSLVVATDLRRNIHENIHKMLPTSEDKASALFASVHDMKQVDDSDEILLALSRLFSVLFRKADSVLSPSAVADLSLLISEVGKGCLPNNFQFVCNLENVFAFKQYPCDYYAYLNKFICNDPYIPEAIKTGTLFSIKDNNSQDVYYVCVSPECDLAKPKTVKKISAVKLVETKIEEKKLKEVNTNKYILFYDEKIKMGTVDPLKVQSEIFFLHETTPPKYYAVEETISQPENCAYEVCLGCNKKTIRIIAQLRPEYAHRLMAQAGAWHSRIGLDFIDIPKKN